MSEESPTKQVALVTGASSGIGKSIAALLAADGVDLVLVARRQDRLGELAGALRKEHGVIARVEPADLSDPDAPRELFDRMMSAGVPVDILVNSAGFGTNGRFWELDAAREVAQVQVNVAALLHLTRLFLPPMVDRGFGRILNIASTAGFQPGPYMATYYATKAFVVSFTDAIASELEGTGVTATAFCPGPVATEFGDISGNGKTQLFKKRPVLEADAVASAAYAAMHRGTAVSVPGAMNSVLAYLARSGPRNAAKRVTAKLNQP